MRLISATVRHYRIHREVTVEFDRALTLVGGPNESGKSTLIEAVHRALFLRARTVGETQKSMMSRAGGGQPEVELAFEARGRTYVLHKRFSGSTGTIRLNERDGRAWTGEEAESQLAELLGVEAAGGGRGVGDRAARQWAHLWVWQGSAGGDPTEHANAQCTALLARLGDDGGAAAMQSDGDGRVAQEVARRHEQLFVSSGNPRAGSDLAQALASESVAAQAHDAAVTALNRLEQAVIDFQEATETIQLSSASLTEVHRELTAAEAKLARVTELRGTERTQSLAATGAAEKHEALRKADERLESLRRELEAAAGAITPGEAETVRLAGEETQCRARHAEAEAACQRAAERVRSVRQRADLAAAHVRRIEKLLERSALNQRLEKVREHQVDLAAAQDALARTPEITAEKLATLQGLESRCSTGTAAVEAMAAGLEVVASDSPVMVGGRILSTGETHILTDEAEVTIGSATRLRIRPGGGSSLADARRELDKCRADLHGELDNAGLATVSAAVEAHALRRKLEGDIETTMARLESLEAAKIAADVSHASNECTGIEAEIDRRAALVSDFPVPGGLAEALELEGELRKELGDAEADESSARAARDVVAERLRISSGQLEAHKLEWGARKQAAADLEAQRRLMVETHGDDAVRREQLASLAAAREEAEKKLEETRCCLEKLQPELLESDRARCQRAIEQHAANRNQAEQRRAVAAAALQRDGTSDPQADFTVAAARLQSERDHREQVEREAEAIRLLHQLFRDEQASLSAQFTRPLAARISSYLECLFGPGARAEVSLAENRFTGLQLVRPNHATGAYDFASLSGGTCEQVAAAVRFAMAEVLAPAHDGCLPLVFDDAFAYSDPERVRTLQRMLDLAAARGLQVIIATCNPSDYATLGARPCAIAAAEP